MHVLNLTQIGNSDGVILPTEAFIRLRLEKGQSVFLTDQVAHSEPDFADLAAGYGTGVAKSLAALRQG